MIDESEIQGKLAAVASGRLSPWDFYGWIQDASWNMHRDSSVAAMALVGDIKLLFEAYYQGAIDEAGLIDRLVTIPVVDVRLLSASLTSTTSGGSHGSLLTCTDARWASRGSPNLRGTNPGAGRLSESATLG